VKLKPRLILTCVSLLLISCASKTVKIEFRNQSGVFLDSTIITINNYTTTLPAIPPNATFVRRIPQDSINISPHDVTVQATPFDKNNTEFKGGYFYNDLFMPNQSVYKIYLDKDSVVKMVYEY
jgi:hypothetical protein